MTLFAALYLASMVTLLAGLAGSPDHRVTGWGWVLVVGVWFCSGGTLALAVLL